MPYPLEEHIVTRATLLVGLTFLLLALTSSPVALAAGNLRGDEVRALISGKRIYLATPFGSELPLTYHADGSLDGEAPGLVKLVQKSDTGSWWISGDRMCQKWRNWYDGKTYCFALTLTDASHFIWHRNDGFSGRGRVAN